MGKTRTSVKPKRQFIDARKVEPKWFIYKADNIGNKFTAQFVPVEAPTTNKNKKAREHCYNMFFGGCTNILKFCLDPTFHRRYQTGIKVGSLDADYFHQYFSEQGGKYKTRVQYLKYYGNTISVQCPSFEFEGFDSLPGLFNDRQYAYMTWSSTTQEIIPHIFYINLCWTIDLVFDYRIYYNKMSFICNPITRMISVDFELTIERSLPGQEQWVKI